MYVFWCLVWDSVPIGWAALRPLYFLHAVHPTNLSPVCFNMYFANYWFLITFNLDKDMAPHPAMRTTSLISVKMFFHFVPIGNAIWTIFSPDANVLVLWDIASANGTMMVDNVVEAWSVASLGFFMPELPWTRERRPDKEYFWNYRSQPWRLRGWCTTPCNTLPRSQG